MADHPRVIKTATHFVSFTPENHLEDMGVLYSRTNFYIALSL